MLLFLLFAGITVGQGNQVISGYVNDAESGEVLIGATVQEIVSGSGVVSNNFGFFSLSFKKDSTAQLKITYVGYEHVYLAVGTLTESRVDFRLQPGVELSEVTVYDNRLPSLVRSTEISTSSIPISDIKKLPSLFGEVDIIKAYQLTPGVKSSGGGKSEMYVRGGSSDQNLIILDDVPLYYVAHFGGLFSVFNTDAVSDTRLIKGGFPARYGGRLSSVLDVRLKDGNLNSFQGSGAVGLFSSRLMLEGPLSKQKSSYMVSGRLSPLPLIKWLTNSRLSYNLYDFNAKVNVRVSENDKLMLGFYFGDDKLVSKTTGSTMARSWGTSWGNLVGSARYSRVFGPKLFSNSMLAFTRYRYKVDHTNELILVDGAKDELNSTLFTGVSDIIFKSDWSFFASKAYSLRFGFSSTMHMVSPNDEDFSRTTAGVPVKREYRSMVNAFEGGIYVENEMEFGPLGINLGARGVNFLVEEKSYSFFEPRMNMNLRLVPNFSLKGAYAQSNQFMHLLSHTGAGAPSDYWLPSSSKIRPGSSRQYNAGLAGNFLNGSLQVSLEGYYKDLSHQIAFKPGRSLVGNLSSWDNVVESNGVGTNYGVELMVHKSKGRTTGWIGATIARSTRKFENLNNGKEFPFNYDRLLDLNLVWNFKLSARINLSATWGFGTGYPTTIPNNKYYLDSHFNGINFDHTQVFSFDEINSIRMRDYHQLDISTNYSIKTSWGESIWTVSIMNVYNRKNPYYYYLDRTFSNDPQNHYPFTVKQVSYLPFMPSFSYSFRF